MQTVILDLLMYIYDLESYREQFYLLETPLLSKNKVKIIQRLKVESQIIWT